MRDRPPWWDLPIVLSPHGVERMQDMDFTEIKLRAMLEDAVSVRPSIAAGRSIVTTAHVGRKWEAIVEGRLSKPVVRQCYSRMHRLCSCVA